MLMPSSLLEELKVHCHCILDIERRRCSFALDRRRGSRFEYESRLGG